MEKLVGVKGVAEILGISPHAVYRLVSSGKIPYIRFRDRGIRFSPRDLEEWLNSNKYRPNGGRNNVSFKDYKREGNLNHSNNEKIWSGGGEDQGKRVSSL